MGVSASSADQTYSRHYFFRLKTIRSFSLKLAVSFVLGAFCCVGILSHLCLNVEFISIHAVSEPDLELFHDNGDVLEAAFEDKPDGSWAARCLFEAYQASKRSGSSVEAGLMQERWLHDIPEFEDIRIE